MTIIAQVIFNVFRMKHSVLRKQEQEHVCEAKINIRLKDRDQRIQGPRSKVHDLPASLCNCQTSGQLSYTVSLTNRALPSSCSRVMQNNRKNTRIFESKISTDFKDGAGALQSEMRSTSTIYSEI